MSQRNRALTLLRAEAERTRPPGHAFTTQEPAMPGPHRLSRRRFLESTLLGAALAPLALGLARRARAAAATLLSPSAPEAKAVQYTEEAKSAKGAQGNTCANCALYQGASGTTQGPCQLFPGKDVKAAGWCSSWAPQM
jgi:hypothetical protein